VSGIPGELFPEALPVERAGAPESAIGGASIAGGDSGVQWEKIPARGAVYLLVAQEEGVEKPLLLATVGDLRAALKRRFTELPPETRSKRIAYGQVCTRIYWRRVDSSFAANWWYAEAARALFPETAAAMIPWRGSWWIGAEREGAFPRLRRTNSLGDAELMYAGPIRDKHATARMIETVEDLFDLCRYHAVLLQAPLGRACAYKEMGKCPAPCDGSVPIAWYREQMDRAWRFLTGETREAWRAETEELMKAAAGRLEFETANRIKQRLARAGLIEGRGAEPYAHMRELGEFSFVALQPGKGKAWVEPWLIHGGRTQCLPQVNRKGLAEGALRVAEAYGAFSKEPVRAPLSAREMEQVALVAHHLARGEDDHGIYVSGSIMRKEGAEAIVREAERLWSRNKVAKPLIEQSSEGDFATSPVADVPDQPQSITPA
jgi:hypothetical protein